MGHGGAQPLRKSTCQKNTCYYTNFHGRQGLPQEAPLQVLSAASSDVGGDLRQGLFSGGTLPFFPWWCFSAIDLVIFQSGVNLFICQGFLDAV